MHIYIHVSLEFNSISQTRSRTLLLSASLFYLIKSLQTHFISFYAHQLRNQSVHLTKENFLSWMNKTKNSSKFSLRQFVSSKNVSHQNAREKNHKRHQYSISNNRRHCAKICGIHSFHFQFQCEKTECGMKAYRLDWNGYCVPQGSM